MRRRSERRASLGACVFVAAVASVVASAFAGCGGGGPPPRASRRAGDTGVESLAWLDGFWSAAAGTHTLFEVWTAPRRGVIYGFNIDFASDDELHHELMRISVREGALTYTAWPETQPRADFTATEVSGTRVVFENARHDFPTRIVYAREGEELDASISGDASDRRVDWHFHRVGEAAMKPLPLRVCASEDGRALRFELGECYCGAQAFLEAYDASDHTDLALVIVDYQCDACERLDASIDVPDGDAPIRLYGEPLFERPSPGECRDGTFPVMFAVPS